MNEKNPGAQGAPESLRGGLAPHVAQIAIRALWRFIIPALLAALVLKYLVPPLGPGFEGWVGHVGRVYPVPLLAALYVVFAALAQYWQLYIPGGRHASSLPAHLLPAERDPAQIRLWGELVDTYERLRSSGVQRRIAGGTGSSPLEALNARLRALRSAILEGHADRARAEAGAARELVRTTRSTYSSARSLAVVGVALGAVAAIFLLRSRVVEPYEVSSSSMLPTLELGDRIAANKLPHRGDAPLRGEVITFLSSAVFLSSAASASAPVPEIMVKRVIGLPGDRIEMQGASVVINGWPVPACDAGRYLYVAPDGSGRAVDGHLYVEMLQGHAYLTVHAFPMPQFSEPYTVREGEVFVLGDNRSNSLDSRSWNGGRGGGLPVEAIRGRAEWFLVGTHRSGEADWGRVLRPLDTLQRQLRVEGLDTTPLTDGVARCLREAPKDTSPPPPDPNVGSLHAGS
jgi:signal peptidase I